MQKKTKSLLIAIFFITLALRLTLAFIVPNLTYESYYHMRHVEHISETGLPLYQDDLSYGERELKFLPFFHYSAALFNLFLPLELVAKILPNLLLASLTIIIFLISKKITNNNNAALFSALIAGLLPVLYNTNSFTPTALFLPLLFLTIYFFLNINHQKSLYLYILSFFLLSFTSSETFLLIIGFFIYLLLSKMENKKTNWAQLELIIFSLFFFLWIQFIFFKNLLLAEGISFIWQNIPTEILTQYFPKISLPEAIILVSLIPFLTGLHVVYRSLFQQKNSKAFLLISFVVSTTLLTWFRLIEFTVSLSFFGLILAILFSLFYQDTLNFVKKLKTVKLKKYLAPTFIVLLIISMIIPAASTALTQNTPVNKEVQAFQWLQQNTPPNSGVLALLEEGHLITYYSQRKNLMDKQFTLIKDADQRFADLQLLFKTSFQTQALGLFDQYGINYLILTPHAQRKYNLAEFPYLTRECFEQVYSQETKIYKIKCSLLETQ